MTQLPRIFILCVLLCAGTDVVSAQTEIERERASLQGLGPFYLTVNIEGTRALVEQEPLDVRRLGNDALAQLQAADLDARSDVGVPLDQRLPYLFLHLNTMDAGRGLVPFSIELRFYQGVRLTRTPSKPTVAATWGSSMVGLVSSDQLHYIPDAVTQLVYDFIQDVQLANR